MVSQVDVGGNFVDVAFHIKVSNITFSRCFVYVMLIRCVFIRRWVCSYFLDKYKSSTEFTVHQNFWNGYRLSLLGMWILRIGLVN